MCVVVEPVALATWGLAAVTFFSSWSRLSRDNGRSATARAKQSERLHSSPRYPSNRPPSRPAREPRRRWRTRCVPLVLPATRSGLGSTSKARSWGVCRNGPLDSGVVILHRIEIFVGQDAHVSTEPVDTVQYGNAYLAHSGVPVTLALSHLPLRSQSTVIYSLRGRPVGQRMARSNGTSSSTALLRNARSRTWARGPV